MMDDIPDVVLMNILSFIPSQSFLPICHVSKRFRMAWIELKKAKQKPNGNNSTICDGINNSSDQSNPEPNNSTNDHIYLSNPFEIGNLFDSPWQCTKSIDNTGKNNNVLNKNLLTYYINNGFGNNSNHENERAAPSMNTAATARKKIKKVMLEAASRGDIEGMEYIAIKGYFLINDEDICTTVAAAGHLDALLWLRGDAKECNNKVHIDKDGETHIICPWNPTEVHREAAENSHDHIMEYVEKNCDDHEIQMHYGVGLPW
mmetsp:Transcript_1747/g.1941  ORF Transcript_1747/g.1941 Transcript_1747/m.1941 type:complete len:260 (+) Transcript_1747:252-1031(+)